MSADQQTNKIDRMNESYVCKAAQNHKTAIQFKFYVCSSFPISIAITIKPLFIQEPMQLFTNAMSFLLFFALLHRCTEDEREKWREKNQTAKSKLPNELVCNLITVSVNSFVASTRIRTT